MGLVTKLQKHVKIWKKEVKFNFMAKRLTFEEVKRRYNEAGLELLEDTYVNDLRMMKVRCKNGHEFKYNLGRLRTAKCCVVCRANNMGVYRV